MKITMIHGQSHVGSSCRLGRLLVEKLGQGHQISEFFLPRDLNRFCLGCTKCIDREDSCPFYEDKRPILDAVEDADLLIFTTPTYCRHASAPMKSFLDLTFTYWMVHRPRAAMFRKKAAVISTAAGNGTGSAIRDIADTLFFWGVPKVHRFGRALWAASLEEMPPKKQAKIHRDLDRLAQTLLREKVRVGLKTKLFFLMMRASQGQYPDTSPEKQYWMAQGWLDRGRPWR